MAFPQPFRAQAWVDGRAIAPADAIAASPTYAHFPSMQTRERAVRGLHHHLRRVDAAHRELFGHGLDLRRVRERWAAAVRDAPDGDLRATYFDDAGGRTHEVIVIRPPVEPSATAQLLRSVRYVRPFAHLKHVGTFAQIAFGNRARQEGYDDALLTTADGEIAETATANIGFLSAGRVVWPSAPALVGTGLQLLDAALRDAGIVVERARVGLDDVAGFEGAFVVNSIGVVPVARIDDVRFSAPGALMSGLEALHDALPWDVLAETE